MKKSVLKKIEPFLYGLSGVLIASLAFAEEGAGHGGEEAITFMGDWLPRFFNFAIIADSCRLFYEKAGS